MSINNNQDLAERVAEELLDKQQRREREAEEDAESWRESRRNTRIREENKEVLKKKFVNAGSGKPLATIFSFFTSIGLVIFMIAIFIVSLIVAGALLELFENSLLVVLVAVPLWLGMLVNKLIYSKIFNRPFSFSLEKE